MDASSASGFHAAGYSDVAAPEINIGSADDYAKSVTVDVSNTNAVRTIFAAGHSNYGGGENTMGGKISIYADTLTVKATSTENGAYGLFVQNGTNSASPENVATIDINAHQTFIDVHSDIENSAYALVALSQGKLNIDGNLYVNTQGGDGAVLTTRGNSVVNINTKKNSTVQLNGNIVFEIISVPTPADSTVNVNLTNADSWWKGNTSFIWYGGNPDETSMRITGMTLNLANGAIWIPTAVTESGNPSTDTSGIIYTPLNNLNISNGRIDLNPGVNLQVDKLNGKGTVNMLVDTHDIQQTGTLTATNAAQGSSVNVNLKGVTSDDLTTNEAVSIVQGVSSNDQQLPVTGHVDEGMVNGGLTVNPDGSVSMGENRVMEGVMEQAALLTTTIDRILTSDLR